MSKRWTQEDLDAYERRDIRNPGNPVFRVGESKPTGKIVIGAKIEKSKPRKVIGGDGVVHDSKLELDHWERLKLRQAAREISGLRRQVLFNFVVNGVHIGDYTADFVYDEWVNEGMFDTLTTRVDECKSKQIRRWQRDFPLRKKLMLACHGIEVREVES